MATPTRRIILIISFLLIGIVLWGLQRALTPRDYQAQKAIIFPSGELRVGVDVSFPPFAWDDNGEFKGVDIDLARAMGAKMGLNVRFVSVGYDGLYDALFGDKIDVLISAMVVNPARMDKVIFTRSYFNTGLMLISPSDAPLTKANELSSKSLAIEFGSDADALARRWTAQKINLQTHPYELAQYALDAVRLGQADVALVDALTYRLYQREHPRWQPTTMYQTETLFAVAVRIDRPSISEWADSILLEMINNGELEQILKKWL
jgi:polar amino acid transport system substrate-binding protein